MKTSVIGVVACCLFLGVTSAQALTPEQTCQFKRASAKGKYEKCVQTWLAKCYAKNPASGQCASVEELQKMSKCGTKYAAVWPKLQTLTGTSCDAERFVGSEEDGTVTDNLTGLVWEMKDDAGGIHDKDNSYTWSTGAPVLENGSAFTDFLSSLNGGGGFAGSTGWRMPTLAELNSILLGPYPCGDDPCIEDIFGDAQSDDYWTATTLSSDSDRAWTVDFGFGGFVDSSDKTGSYPVRAVRGGF